MVTFISDKGMTNLVWTNVRLNEVPEDAFDIPESCLGVSYTQQAHDVRMTSDRRRCDVNDVASTSIWRHSDVDLASF